MAIVNNENVSRETKFEFRIVDDTLYLVCRIENLPDFPPIENRIPIITKDIAFYIFNKWIMEGGNDTKRI